MKAAGAGGESGYNAGKSVSGRKRHIGVDTLGLLRAVAVTAASVDDAAAAPRVLARFDAAAFPRLEVIWADSKYHNHALNEWAAAAAPRWRIEVVRRPAGVKGFVLLPKRWVIERTFGWLMRSRRLGRDHERRTDSSEAMVQVSSIHLSSNGSSRTRTSIRPSAIALRRETLFGQTLRRLGGPPLMVAKL